MDAERVAELVRPLARDASLELYDVEQLGNTLRVSLSGVGGRDAHISDLESVSRSLSLALDEAELGGGSYLLEVSTPGIERKLRTSVHFSGAVGEIVSVTTRPPEGGRRRLRGELMAADDATVTICDDEAGEVTVDFDEVEKAKTIFEWGPAPKPGKPNPSRSRNKADS
ncbi:MAG: ribosome maturation factor RimP [Actinomycetia bacterium]|nr:ribosome maturation factor RimP [Actinomycetes bacterium]